MTPLAPQDIPKALDWLQSHATGPIFLESNLRNHGLAGDAFSVRIWRAGARGMVGLTGNGILLPQMTHATQADWQALRATLAGETITAMNGEAAQIDRLPVLLGLQGAKTNLHKTEPGFTLNLSDLIMPAAEGLHLAPIRPQDEALMAEWRAAYMVETLGQSPEAAAPEAARQIARARAEDSHRILWRGAQPVSFTGFNARLPGLVQIGGVYTPPALRAQGLARAAVALHLAEARGQGVTRATLFAASDNAARAYKAIGFRRAGDVTLILYAAPQVIA
ncbi:MAG: GNAT family N-acetyltransferase [Paracoccus sp. (in: a-proteobacteria)]|nr:GNAT family N-acetyltransferase [Paracoccus sp. (in: a-proteobacteria)]